MSKKKATSISLPLSKTAKIMTSAVGVESVNQDIVALATKATEIFLIDLARRAYDQTSEGEEFRSNSLQYDDIQKLVHNDTRYDFLVDATPKRIKFSEAIRLVHQANEAEAIRKAEEAVWLEERRQELDRRRAEAKLKQEQKMALEEETKNQEYEMKGEEEAKNEEQNTASEEDIKPVI